jgi:hypothetical protein
MPKKIKINQSDIENIVQNLVQEQVEDVKRGRVRYGRTATGATPDVVNPNADPNDHMLVTSPEGGIFIINLRTGKIVTRLE